jgi:hypothetical protein
MKREVMSHNRVTVMEQLREPLADHTPTPERSERPERELILDRVSERSSLRALHGVYAMCVRPAREGTSSLAIPKLNALFIPLMNDRDLERDAERASHFKLYASPISYVTVTVKLFNRIPRGTEST